MRCDSMRARRSASLIAAFRIKRLLYTLGASPPICRFDSGRSGVLLTMEFHFSFLYLILMQYAFGKMWWISGASSMLFTMSIVVP